MLPRLCMPPPRRGEDARDAPCRQVIVAGETVFAKESIMNEGMKYGLWFLGGVAVGVLGAVAVSRGKAELTVSTLVLDVPAHDPDGSRLCH